MPQWPGWGKASAIAGVLGLAFGVLVWVFDTRAGVVAAVVVEKSEERHEGTHASESVVAEVRQDAVIRQLDTMQAQLSGLSALVGQQIGNQYTRQHRRENSNARLADGTLGE